MIKNDFEIKSSIANKRWLNEIKRKNIVYSSEYRPRKKHKKKQDSELIILPEIINIYLVGDEDEDDVFYNKTLNIINAISRFDGYKIKKVNLDFSRTDSIKAASILVLYATIELAIKKGISFKILSLSKNYKVTSAIKKSGIVELCKKNVTVPDFKGGYLPVISGSGGDFRDEIVDFIQNKIYKNKMSPEVESVYGGAIQEAINNVSYHAYPQVMESENKKWWVTCDLVEDQLFLAIYDKGVGIPETVMKREWYRNVLRIEYPNISEKVNTELRKEGVSSKELLLYNLGVVSDAIKIAVSMIGDVTGTSESKHGQGSKSIKALVSENDRGTLWIYSNNGLYKLKSGKIDTINLPKPILGTLIQWNIKVDVK